MGHWPFDGRGQEECKTWAASVGPRRPSAFRLMARWWRAAAAMSVDHGRLFVGRRQEGCGAWAIWSGVHWAKRMPASTSYPTRGPRPGTDRSLLDVVIAPEVMRHLVGPRAQECVRYGTC